MTAHTRISTWHHRVLLLESIVLFSLAVVATHFASRFAAIKASSPVDDIILSNTRVFNFEFVFVHVAIGLCLFVVFLCFRYKRGAPFIIKSVSLFIIIRALFVSLTHIGPFPTRLSLESNLLSFITSGNDLFFSGHTGLPLLIALIFWKHRNLRILFLSTSIFFGLIVLLSHLHYSIDVFAAFFITYAIYHIALRIFREDYHHFILEERALARLKTHPLVTLLKKGAETVQAKTKKRKKKLPPQE